MFSFICQAVQGVHSPLYFYTQRTLTLNPTPPDTHRDGVLNAPLYFHNAVLYATHGCQFIDPEFEGTFNTLGYDVMAYITDPEIGLAVVSRAVFSGRLFHIPTGKRVKWVPDQTMIQPLSTRMKAAMNSLEYGAIRDACTTKGVFRIDFEDAGFVGEDEWTHAVPLDEIDTYHGREQGPLGAQESCCIS